ncbi:hypothetical protein T11_14287 [Trichinella zimbabwensis]|uniref:Uncharacterized protein n=1 Tax=Trichinella zimbabwensis TaxID=268475 RepID=A0A0V1HWQ5_9BILA|nr:hypothetical protein T11_14287 [Trichinella zimbabwensis]
MLASEEDKSGDFSCELRVVKIAVLVTPMSDQKGCNVMIWTNLDIISVISLKEHIPYCQVYLQLAYKMEKKQK